MIDAPVRGKAVINEVECKSILCALGVGCEGDWLRWLKVNRVKRQQLSLPFDPVKAYGNGRFWSEIGPQHPRHWKSFQGNLKRGEVGIPPKTLKYLSRFAARYRLASGFRGVYVSGLKSDTVNGYGAAFGVFLAYSALEACCKALSMQVSRQVVFDLILAEKLRQTSKVAIRFMQEELENARLLKQLSGFTNGESNDVLLFAAAIRHLVAHGNLTAWGFAITNFRSIVVFRELSEAILQHCDYLFKRHALC